MGNDTFCALKWAFAVRDVPFYHIEAISWLQWKPSFAHADDTFRPHGAILSAARRIALQQAELAFARCRILDWL